MRSKQSLSASWTGGAHCLVLRAILGWVHRVCKDEASSGKKRAKRIKKVQVNKQEMCLWGTSSWLLLFLLSRDGRLGHFWKDSGSGLNRTRENYPDSLFGGILSRAVVREKEESGGWRGREGHVTYPGEREGRMRENSALPSHRQS